MRLFPAIRPAWLFPFLLLIGGCGETRKPAPPPAETPPAAQLSRPGEPPPEPPPGTAPASKKPELGVNLAGLNDWSSELPFVDVFKTSRPWFGKRGDVPTATHGGPEVRPGEPVETLMLREIQGHYPGGTYLATYKGSGKVEMARYDVRAVVRQAAGRVESDVKPGDGGIQLLVTESDPKDPVRDFRVTMPGFEKAKSPFYPPFMKRLEPFRVLRFMDWQRTNNSKITRWSERAEPSEPRYTTEKGAPAEVMVELANARKSPPWFCMPHLADDEYIRSFAELVKSKLDPELKVYVELSNEVWNGQFAQNRWSREQGGRLKLDDPNGFRFYSQRAVEVFAIWEKVFGGKERLVRVLAAQFANPATSEEILAWRDAHKHADALAVAPYFGYSYGDPKTADRVARMDADTLLAELEAEVKGPNRELIRKQAAVAAKHGVKLIAYEGGQHLAGFAGAENNDAMTRLFLQANRSPKMGELYNRHLDNWFAEGGGLYVLYNSVARPTKWGSWGLLEYQDQDVADAPKYRAVADFATRAAK